MSKSWSKVVFGISTASLVGLYSLVLAPSASAASGGNKTVEVKANGNSSTSTRPLPLLNFSLNDVGKSFLFNFDGSVDTQTVTGLSSKALFTFKSFTGNEATFDVDLENTSSGGISSRTSALGFNVYSGLGSTNKLDLSSANTQVSGLFSNSILGGALPNQFGGVDVCFTNGNTCQGGQGAGNGGGVSTGEGSQKLSFTLGFNNAVNSFALGNFGARYQSIDGNGFNGASGTGLGQYQPGSPQPEPTQVPESSTSVALALFGLGALRVVKKKALQEA